MLNFILYWPTIWVCQMFVLPQLTVSAIHLVSLWPSRLNRVSSTFLYKYTFYSYNNLVRSHNEWWHHPWSDDWSAVVSQIPIIYWYLMYYYHYHYYHYHQSADQSFDMSVRWLISWLTCMLCESVGTCPYLPAPTALPLLQDAAIQTQDYFMTPFFTCSFAMRERDSNKR